MLSCVPRGKRQLSWRDVATRVAKGRGFDDMAPHHFAVERAQCRMPEEGAQKLENWLFVRYTSLHPFLLCFLPRTLDPQP